jgi:ribose transport system permease protein
MMTASTTPPGPAVATTVEQPVDDRGLSPASPLANWVKTRAAWIFLLDVGLVIYFTMVTRGHVFWSTANGQSLLLGVTEALLLALGLSMMLGAGIFDLSLGANLVLSAVVGAKVMRHFQKVTGDPTSYHNVWWAICLGLIACVVAGVLYGLINGLIVAVADVNSLIATLATLGIGTGTALLLTKGSDIGAMPVVLQTDIGLKTFGVVPLPALAALAAVAGLWAVVRFTRYGLRVQAIGSSRASAERAGIRVKLHLISLTVLAGAMAGLAGFIDLSRFGSTALAGHQNDALAAVTAAVIGGTLLEGGYISIIGTLWGAALAVILQAGLVITGVSSFWQLIVVGVVLLVAVVLDRVAYKRRARARH